MSTKDRFTALSMPNSCEKHFADNEVFMSFNNDDDAICFHDWWHRSGSANFKKFNDRRKEFYDRKPETFRCRNCRKVGPTEWCESCKSEGV
jgi:hypothetical protein